jgi:hypothetical protein
MGFLLRVVLRGGASAPSPASIRGLMRLYHSAVRGGRPVLGASLAQALGPLVAGAGVGAGAGATPSPALAPLARALGSQRHFSLAMRMAASGFNPWRSLGGGADPAEQLQRLEALANREPGNVTAQLQYAQALQR